MIIWPAKGPTEVEDFEFDFTDLLQPGESIAGATVTVDGVTKDDDDIVDVGAAADAGVKVWLSGGTAGTVAKVTCTAVTDSSPPRTYSEVAVLEIGGEAISLATAKMAQKIDNDDEDLVLAAFLRAAIGHVQAVTGKRLTQKIVTQALGGFPYGQRSDAVRLWHGPVSEVLSIEYDDSNGDTQPLDSFRLVAGGSAGSDKLLPAYGECFPIAYRGEGTVRVSYVAGYDPTELPPELVQAAILLFGHFNANREAAVVTASSASISELPLGVQALIGPYRMPGIG